MIGKRLEEERKRLTLTQRQSADIGGLSLRSYGLYERGQCFPDAQFLSSLSAAGFDVQYILTGVRSELSAQGDSLMVNPRERAVLNLYKSLTPEAQDEIFRSLTDKKRLIDLEQQLQALSRAA